MNGKENGEPAIVMSVVVITYRRERVLVDSLRHILELGPGELIVVDQTPCHEPATDAALKEWMDAGPLRLLRKEQPSIPEAMNTGLIAARGEIVLFLDDDIVPNRELLKRHEEAHAERPEAGVVVGQVLQPGQHAEPLRAGEGFRGNATEQAWIDRALAGNMSVKRRIALAVGGFDENFVGAAYHFETEFARRMIAAGHRVLFEPRASIRHLRAGTGGTRSKGGHLATWRPDHAVGAYYFALVAGTPADILRRFLRAAATRHHLRRPWWIPVTFLAELRGLVWALRLWLSGRRLLSSSPAGS